MRFEVTLEVFRNLDNNNVKVVWSEVEYGNKLGIITVAYKYQNWNLRIWFILDCRHILPTERNLDFICYSLSDITKL